MAITIANPESNAMPTRATSTGGRERAEANGHQCGDLADAVEQALHYEIAELTGPQISECTERIARLRRDAHAWREIAGLAVQS